MDISVRTTKDLSAEEIRQICRLFSTVFGREKDPETFNRQFGGARGGYSFHALMRQEGIIVGAWSFIPLLYEYQGRPLRFALSVDTMVREGFRGNLGLIVQMDLQACAAMSKAGIQFVYGFPNKNFHRALTSVLQWRELGRLDFFVLPVSLGAFRRSLRPFDPLMRAFARAMNCSYVRPGPAGSGMDQKGDPIALVMDEEFRRYRFGIGYQAEKLPDGSSYVYLLRTEEGIRTAHILDYSPWRRDVLFSAVKAIYQRHRQEIDAVLFLGRMEQPPCNLIRVPRVFNPRAVVLCGRRIGAEVSDEIVYDIGKWRVGLANFDVR